MIGLIGTITFDRITHESRTAWEGVGGVLYQAAVLCAQGKKVSLYTNLGKELTPDVKRITKRWSTLLRHGINPTPGPGNQVHLHYPERGERIEVLKSVVPPLNLAQILKDLPRLEMLILVLNSGYDIELDDWRRIVHSAQCPIWLDVHSLPLSKKLNVPRIYEPLNDWVEWAGGITYIQANKKETASMLGYPEKDPSPQDILDFGERAFDSGIQAAFITLGEEGVLVLTPTASKRISSHRVDEVVDTTGCGDVFCGGTATALIQGRDPFRAASFGLQLALKAIKARGIEETFISVRS